MGRKKGRKGKKRRTHEREAPPEQKKVEKSFVIKRGNIGKTLQALLEDMRNVMRPNTAINLKERKSNALKDFLDVAGPLGITHFMIFSATESAAYLRIAKAPHGPTLTFGIKWYTLMRDIAQLQQRPKTPGVEYNHPPLMIMNNFTAQRKDIQLMNVVFQRLFPPINVQTVKLADCQRVVLVSYDDKTDSVQFRHYLIKVNPTGVSKSVKRFALQSVIPDLHNLQDISQYILRESMASESDVEDGPESHITLDEEEYASVAGKRHKRKRKSKGPVARQSAIRLVEIGPRMELKLIKIQTDFCDGEVLFHQYVHKTKEEVEALREQKEKNKELKRQRRQQLYESLKAKGKPIPDDLEKEFGEGAKEEGDEGSEDESEDEGEGEGEDGEVSRPSGPRKRKSEALEQPKRNVGKAPSFKKGPKGGPFKKQKKESEQ